MSRRTQSRDMEHSSPPAPPARRHHSIPGSTHSAAPKQTDSSALSPPEVILGYFSHRKWLNPLWHTGGTKRTPVHVFTVLSGQRSVRKTSRVAERFLHLERQFNVNKWLYFKVNPLLWWNKSGDCTLNVNTVKIYRSGSSSLPIWSTFPWLVHTTNFRVRLITWGSLIGETIYTDGTTWLQKCTVCNTTPVWQAVVRYNQSYLLFQIALLIIFVYSV